MDIQLIFTQCVFSSVKSSKECLVPSLPVPESFTPPKGISSDLGNNFEQVF